MKKKTPQKKRDAESTRARIFECAQQAFTEKGYDGAGIREIAACAGVNAALISRYFGSKQELFEHAVLPHFELGDLLDLDTSAFAETVASAYAQKPARPHEGFDPMIALLKSAASPDVRGAIAGAIDRQIIGPLAGKLDGENRAQRAALIVAWLGGFDLFRRIIGLSSMPEAETEFLQRQLEASLERLVSGQP